MISRPLPNRPAREKTRSALRRQHSAAASSTPPETRARVPHSPTASIPPTVRATPRPPSPARAACPRSSCRRRRLAIARLRRSSRPSAIRVARRRTDLRAAHDAETRARCPKVHQVQVQAHHLEAEVQAHQEGQGTPQEETPRGEPEEAVGIKPKAPRNRIPAQWPYKEELMQEIDFGGEETSAEEAKAEVEAERCMENSGRARGGGGGLPAPALEDRGGARTAPPRLRRQEGGRRRPPDDGVMEDNDSSRRAYYKEFVKVVEVSDDHPGAGRATRGRPLARGGAFVRRANPDKLVPAEQDRPGAQGNAVAQVLPRGDAPACPRDRRRRRRRRRQAGARSRPGRPVRRQGRPAADACSCSRTTRATAT